VKREVWVGFQVSQPASLAGRRNAADVDASVDVVKDDLDAAWSAGSAARGRDVDRVPTLESGADRVI
jgi:hypothetical protein